MDLTRGRIGVSANVRKSSEGHVTGMHEKRSSREVRGMNRAARAKDKCETHLGGLETNQKLANRDPGAGSIEKEGFVVIRAPRRIIA